MHYLPLFIKTEYSLLNSMIKIPDLVAFAKKNNLKALTITDDNLCGGMEFYKNCMENDIKPVFGLTIHLENSIYVLYAKNKKGYQNLIKLSSIYSERKLEIKDLKEYKEEVIAIIPYQSLNLKEALKEIYTDIYFSYENKEQRDQIEEEKRVYMKEILYLEKEDSKYLDYVYAIRDGILLDQVTSHKQDNHLKLEIENLENNQEILNMCNVEIEETGFHIPKFECPEEYQSYDYLKYLCKEGLKKRFGNMVPIKYIDRLKYELNVIHEMNFDDYFLIVWDYIEFAKKNDILVGPGRGSAAGSLVSYCLGIIEIDPLKYNLLFERFLNKNRVTLPDIDIDFDGFRKEEVIEYCKQKYGEKRVANIITFSSLTSKQVIKDVGRVLDLPVESVDYLTKMVRTKSSLQHNYETSDRIRNHLMKNEELKKLYQIAMKLEGLKKHISIHASGVVISKIDLDEVIPTVTYENMLLSGYSMEYLESLGLIKMDFLSLKTLTTMKSIIDEIRLKEPFKLEDISLTDEKTLDLFKCGNTIGVFQFESSGMIALLNKFKPVCFEELYHIIALYRPGPMGNIDTFIRRRNRLEKVDYLHPNLVNVLKSTYGILIYQEQIMQVANIMANYTLGEADILRRAMSKKKESILLKEKEKFISRSVQNGYDLELSNKVYHLILKFAEYGFNKSHSVAYALISFQMAYLKAHYPAYFLKNLLSSVIGSDMNTKEYIKECKNNGIKILPPDIVKSGKEYTIEENSIRFSLTNIKNVGIIVVEHILERRRQEPFKDFLDFVTRTNRSVVNRLVIQNLVYAGCFDSFGYTRKTLIENLDAVLNYAELLDDLNGIKIEKPEIVIYEEYSKKELTNHEFEALGFYLHNHPVKEYRVKYKIKHSLSSISNYLNKNIEVIACVDSKKEIRTKNGDRICFLKCSDEFDIVQAVLFSETYKQYDIMKVGDIIKIKGRTNRREGKDQLIVNQVEVIEE